MKTVNAIEFLKGLPTGQRDNNVKGIISQLLLAVNASAELNPKQQSFLIGWLTGQALIETPATINESFNVYVSFATYINTCK